MLACVSSETENFLLCYVVYFVNLNSLFYIFDERDVGRRSGIVCHSGGSTTFCVCFSNHSRGGGSSHGFGKSAPYFKRNTRI